MGSSIKIDQKCLVCGKHTLTVDDDYKDCYIKIDCEDCGWETEVHYKYDEDRNIEVIN